MFLYPVYVLVCEYRLNRRLPKQSFVCGHHRSFRCVLWPHNLKYMCHIQNKCFCGDRNKVRSVIDTEVIMMTAIFRDMTTRSLTQTHRHFEGQSCMYHHILPWRCVNDVARSKQLQSIIIASCCSLQRIPSVLIQLYLPVFIGTVIHLLQGVPQLSAIINFILPG